jgi:hypothetical protein
MSIQKNVIMGVGFGFGPELLTNGTFDTVTTGWTIQGATCTIAVVAGEIEITNSGAAGGFVHSDNVTLVAGRRYRLRFRMRRGTSSSISVAVRASPGDAVLATMTSIDTANRDDVLDFIASTSAAYVRLGANQAVLGRTAYFDNLSMKRFR